MWPTLGQRVAKILNYMLPESLWDYLGDHRRDEEGEEDGREEEEATEGEEEAAWEPLGALLGPPGSFLRTSWRFWGTLGDFLEASLAVLGRAWLV